MNHFLHLLILLAALFTPIIALPTTPFDATANSWTDPTLDNADTLLAGTFDGLSASSSTISQDPQASNSLEKLPPVKTQPQDQNWSQPLFLCCTNTRAWVDDADEQKCRITTRDDNDSSCTWQGEARYCPKGIRTTVLTDCYRYKTGT